MFYIKGLFYNSLFNKLRIVLKDKFMFYVSFKENFYLKLEIYFSILFNKANITLDILSITRIVFKQY